MIDLIAFMRIENGYESKRNAVMNKSKPNLQVTTHQYANRVSPPNPITLSSKIKIFFSLSLHYLPFHLGIFSLYFN